MFPAPEKTGEVGRNGIQQLNDSCLFDPGEHIDSNPKGFKLAISHPFSQAGPDQFFFSAMKVDAAEFINQAADFLKIRLRHFCLLDR